MELPLFMLLISRHTQPYNFSFFHTAFICSYLFHFSCRHEFSSWEKIYISPLTPFLLHINSIFKNRYRSFGRYPPFVGSGFPLISFHHATKEKHISFMRSLLLRPFAPLSDAHLPFASSFQYVFLFAQAKYE